MRIKKKLELKEKGWSEKEIIKAESIIDREEQRDIHFSKIVFWSALVVIVFANLIASFVLIPFLLVLKKWFLYIIVITLAGTIGFLYNFLITDIGHLNKKHHLLAGILVPVLAIINLVIVLLISNQFIIASKINQPYNIYLVSGIFAIAFILPYIIDRLFIKSWK